VGAYHGRPRSSFGDVSPFGNVVVAPGSRGELREIANRIVLCDLTFWAKVSNWGEEGIPKKGLFRHVFTIFRFDFYGPSCAAFRCLA